MAEHNRTGLEPIEPRTAKKLYLREKATEASESTVKAHDYRLRHFVRWCDEKGIDNLNDLTGRLLKEYRLWRTEEGDLNKVTVKTQMDTLRVFIRWCEAIDAVEMDLHTKVQSPTLDSGDNQRDAILESEEAEAILEYLSTYQYASFDHALMATLWETGMRIGAAHSLDVEDIDTEQDLIETKHRPDTDTPLKNKEEGERLVAISPDLTQVLTDWIEVHRPDVTDDYGRRPVFTTSQGRAHTTTLRDTVYRWTRPCAYTGECPHGENPETCEAGDRRAKAYYKCPSTVSPHAIRRGRVTHLLSNDVPVEVVGDHVNASREVLSKWYDRRSEEQKVEQRRAFLEHV
ncbi:tyrosine-type recombinase/integrase [Natrarchaeobaculum sulfurireducens]|uniref:Integrase family protein n=1 Tax=Natrarchaeobaculum sulfurireducens TaxID=2044521 RepID=A0A346PPK2_9EURY|nr:site-specific integrase [Natrarchaeobaculum sulfurireducens]AXR81447.1 integrase family protein [Natrarchaeobaculum sulfurireducens]